jgi:predicted TIM-barrel fold metal-dependent hydrolase
MQTGTQVLPDGPRKLLSNEFSTSQYLEHAAQQARERNYQDFLIVDVDSHHYESESYAEVFQYIESPVIRRAAMESAGRAGRSSMMNSQVGYQDIGGRITRHTLRKYEKVSGGQHRDIVLTKRWMDAMGVDYACLFPTPMLFLGLHPQVEIEAAMAQAYNRWLCERILEEEPRLVSMLYLPFNDPEAAYRTVKEFGHRKGVTGFMVTSPRYKPVHDNIFMKTYALLEEMGKPIAFHAAYNWNDQALSMTNRFISVHALGFMWFNMVHMTNWVVNGLPERFPKLKVLWIESGLTWAYCLMQRLDHSYMMRISDCPSLKRKPSEYMREMYYSTQPMERPADNSILEATFKMINAETQLLWSSDYPHWDFDLPSVIYDLPFLNEQAKRNILGANAARLFGLGTKVVKSAPDQAVGARKLAPLPAEGEPCYPA